MWKAATRFRFFSQDQGLYRPLVLEAPSRISGYSTMSDSHPIATAHPPPDLIFPTDVVTNDGPLVAPQNDNEPIVTRKELWSYYRMFLLLISAWLLICT